jgi:hypothetical protein
MRQEFQTGDKALGERKMMMKASYRMSCLGLFMLLSALISAPAALHGAEPAGSCTEIYCIEWATIDNGGIIASSSEDDNWSLSGSVGQMDASSAFELSSGQWRLTGGFWALSVGELPDLVFDDRFED